MSLDLDWDVVAPRDEAHRFRLYVRRGDDLDLLAMTPTAQGIGLALATLDAEARAAGRRDGIGSAGAVGVLDGISGQWIVMPWHRPEEKARFIDGRPIA